MYPTKLITDAALALAYLIAMNKHFDKSFNWFQRFILHRAFIILRDKEKQFKVEEN